MSAQREKERRDFVQALALQFMQCLMQAGCPLQEVVSLGEKTFLSRALAAHQAIKPALTLEEVRRMYRIVEYHANVQQGHALTARVH